MTAHSQHPEVHVEHELREAVERVASGIERVIVLTDAGGEPLAAIVSIAALGQLDQTDTTENGVKADEADRSNIHFR